jgi:hypothetical protein
MFASTGKASEPALGRMVSQGQVNHKLTTACDL